MATTAPTINKNKPMNRSDRMEPILPQPILPHNLSNNDMLAKNLKSAPFGFAGCKLVTNQIYTKSKCVF